MSTTDELAIENAMDYLEAQKELEQIKQQNRDARTETYTQVSKIQSLFTDIARDKIGRDMTGVEFATYVASELLRSAQSILEAAGYDHVSEAIKKARQGEV